MVSKYIVETEFLYGWENVWTDGETGEPTVYNTKEEAQAELDDFIADTELDHRLGLLEEPYDIGQYRIVEVAQ
jgi:hypothetical protein